MGREVSLGKNSSPPLTTFPHPRQAPLVDLFPLSSFLFTCFPLFSFHISQTSAHLYLLPLFPPPFFRFFASILQQRVTCEWHPVLALPQRVDCFVLKTYDTNTGRTQKHKQRPKHGRRRLVTKLANRVLHGEVK